MSKNQFVTGISPSLAPIYENPPRFTWFMEENKAPYVLEVSQDENFLGHVTMIENIPYNFYTPDKPLPAGKYFWRVNSDMQAKAFVIEENLPESPIPARNNRYENVSNAHPRLWLNPEKAAHFKKDIKNNAVFDDFYKNSVLNRIEEGFPQEPERYPNDIRVVALWRGNYMTCQAAMCYIRSLSIAGVLLDDADIIGKAKAALLDIARWDYALETGSTTRLYNDECAYRVGYALAYGYDWLYNELTAEERETVLTSLYARTKEIAEYAIIEKKIHNFPYDSHAVRSLSMMIIPSCIAMLDLDSNDQRHIDAKNWLDYALEYLSALYTPWGGMDGGWAEGPAYWTTGMAFVTEAIGFMRNYMNINLFDRPFFQNTGDFMLNCNPPKTRYASFCDQSNLSDRPGPKMAFNMRLFGGVTGNGLYQWYFNRVMEYSVMNPEHFSEKGWWDLYYDNVVFSHDYGNVTEVAPPDGLMVKHFRDVGWVAVNKNMADPENHILLLTKSSPFGSLSHSHADQNSFLLHAFGQPLIILSGHYVGYGTQMHLSWRKQTKSSNAILIDGIGQYAGRDYEAHHKARAGDQDITAGEEKVNQLSAKGKVLDVSTKDGETTIVMDATEAYIQNVPYLTRYVRTICWQKDDTIVIKDNVTLTQDGKVSALLHGICPFEIKANGFTLNVNGIVLEGAVASASGIESITQTDVFEGVNEKESEGRAKQNHLSMNTGLAAQHEIITALKVTK